MDNNYIKTLGVFVLAQNTQPFNFHMPKQQQVERLQDVFKRMESSIFPFRVLTDNAGNAIFVFANTNLKEMKSISAWMNIHTFLFADKVEIENNKSDTFKIYSLNKDYYRNEVNTLYNAATKLYKDILKVDYEGDYIKEICFTDEWIYPNFVFFNFKSYDETKYEEADKTVEVNVSSVKDRLNEVYQNAENKLGHSIVSSAIYDMIHHCVCGMSSCGRCQRVFYSDKGCKTITVDGEQDEYTVMTDCISAIPLLF